MNGELFVKRVRVEGAIASYPELRLVFETFTSADFLELETLGPLTQLQPGETATHAERWTAHQGVHISQWDAELDRLLAPLVG